MIAKINGQDKELKDKLTIENLVIDFGYQNHRIAVEVNESIIPKSQHSEFTITGGDKIEIIKAVGGG